MEAQQSVPTSPSPGQIPTPTPTPTPAPTPAPTPLATPTPASTVGNCHSVITSPPQPKETQKPGSAKGPVTSAQAAQKKQNLSISAETPVIIDADECDKAGNIYSLHGNIKIHSADYDLRGDTATFDSSTADVTAKGNVSLDGGHRDLHLTATEAYYNVRTHTGKFYNVHGSTGARFKGRSVTLTSSSPISFTGKYVEQTGPDEYVLHHASVTSCELPHPKWTFNAQKIILRVGNYARVRNSSFRLKGVPVFYLPYVSPPVERLGRKSGFLIPTFGTSSTKGTVIGDSFYWAINRSMDATLGGEYLSKRGWELQENFRARPSEKSFLNLNYFGVIDRGITTTSITAKGLQTTTTPQGGEDVKLNAETIFPANIRGVASIEYLSSFVFRLAFTENFSQAVDSEVKSSVFATKSIQGFSFNTYLARYQNFQSTTADDVVTILHTPAVEFTGVDRPIFHTPVYWSYDVAAEGVRRSDPLLAPTVSGLVTPGIVGRFDVDPDINLPLFFKGWTFRPEVQLRNTVYSQQQLPTVVPNPPNPPVNADVDVKNVLNRRSIATTVELRPPALSRIFDHTVAGRKLKHTIEPRLVYRYTNGIENFSHIIRFDFRDILSNTNEVEAGLTQRVFLKREHAGCNDEPTPAPAGTAAQVIPAAPCVPAGADEFVTWEVKMKYFADPTFGGAVQNGTRNVFTTSVNFTGIAFITDPRRFSPVVSRFRIRTSANSDLEWQLDYDTKKGRINSSTLYAGYHFGDWFVGASHAYLQVPGEIVTDPTKGTVLPVCPPHVISQFPCVAPLFDQLRGQLGYGSPTKRGWSAAANVGIDREFNLLQYSAAQTSYNWDCCGLSFEYRRFSLPAVRNENQYRFAFTLANIGSFGNLKRQERLF
ncbi:MAG TPA: LPS assembly protein LptD [Candidatus Angelobacter sp.]|jgi:LPS-assembly protein